MFFFSPKNIIFCETCFFGNKFIVLFQVEPNYFLDISKISLKEAYDITGRMFPLFAKELYYVYYNKIKGNLKVNASSVGNW